MRVSQSSNACRHQAPNYLTASHAERAAREISHSQYILHYMRRATDVCDSSGVAPTAQSRRELTWLASLPRTRRGLSCDLELSTALVVGGARQVRHGRSSTVDAGTTRKDTAPRWRRLSVGGACR